MNGLKPSSANFCRTFSASARELNGPTSTRNNLSPERTSPGVSRKAEYPRPFKTPTSVAASCLELEATTWTAKPPCRPALLSAAAESRAGRQGGLAVQVVASSSRQDAATLVGVLKGRGYSAFLLTPGEVRSGDKLFRVEVGPFSSRAEAEKVRQKLADEGFKPFIRY